jgi:hypothetical protein
MYGFTVGQTNLAGILNSRSFLRVKADVLQSKANRWGIVKYDPISTSNPFVYAHAPLCRWEDYLRLNIG